MAIEKITVIGVGTMGHGIAQVAAAAGAGVHMNDISAEAIDKGMSALRANLDKGIEKGKVTQEQRDAILGRLVAAPDLDAAAGAHRIGASTVDLAPAPSNQSRPWHEQYQVDRVANVQFDFSPYKDLIELYMPRSPDMWARPDD